MDDSKSGKFQELASQLGVLETKQGENEIPDALQEESFMNATQKSFAKLVLNSPEDPVRNIGAEDGSFFQSVSTIKRRQTKARTRALLDSCQKPIENKTATRKKTQYSKKLDSKKQNLKKTCDSAKKARESKCKKKSKRKPKFSFSSDEEFVPETIKIEDEVEAKVLPTRASKRAARKKLTTTTRTERFSFDSDEKENIPDKPTETVSVLVPDSDEESKSESGSPCQPNFESKEDSMEIIPDSDESFQGTDNTVPASKFVAPPPPPPADVNICSQSLFDNSSESSVMSKDASSCSNYSSVSSNAKKGKKASRAKKPVIVFTDSEEETPPHANDKSSGSASAKKSTGNGKDINALNAKLELILSTKKAKKSKCKTPTGNNSSASCNSSDTAPKVKAVKRIVRALNTLGPEGRPPTGNKVPAGQDRIKALLQKSEAVLKGKEKKKPRGKTMNVSNQSSNSKISDLSFSSDDSRLDIPAKPFVNDVMNSTRISTGTSRGRPSLLDISMIPSCNDRRSLTENPNQLAESKQALCPVKCSVTLQKLDIDVISKLTTRKTSSTDDSSQHLKTCIDSNGKKSSVSNVSSAESSSTAIETATQTKQTEADITESVKNISIQCSFTASQESHITDPHEENAADESCESDATVDYSHHEEKYNDSWSEDEECPTNKPNGEEVHRYIRQDDYKNTGNGDIEPNDTPLPETANMSLQISMAQPDTDPNSSPETASMSLQVSMLPSQDQEPTDNDASTTEDVSDTQSPGNLRDSQTDDPPVTCNMSLQVSMEHSQESKSDCSNGTDSPEMMNMSIQVSMMPSQDSTEPDAGSNQSPSIVSPGTCSSKTDTTYSPNTKSLSLQVSMAQSQEETADEVKLHSSPESVYMTAAQSQGSYDNVRVESPEMACMSLQVSMGPSKGIDESYNQSPEVPEASLHSESDAPENGEVSLQVSMSQTQRSQIVDDASDNESLIAERTYDPTSGDNACVIQITGEADESSAMSPDSCDESSSGLFATARAAPGGLCPVPSGSYTYLSPDPGSSTSPAPMSPIINLDIQFGNAARSPRVESDVSFTSPTGNTSHQKETQSEINADVCNISIQASLPSQASPKTEEGESSPEKDTRPLEKARQEAGAESESDEFHSCDEDLFRAGSEEEEEAEKKLLYSAVHTKTQQDTKLRKRRDDSSDDDDDDLEAFFQKVKNPSKEVEVPLEVSIHEFIVSDGSVSDQEDDAIFHINVDRKSGSFNSDEEPDDSVDTSSTDEEESEEIDKKKKKLKFVVELSSDDDDIFVVPKSKTPCRTPRSQVRGSTSSSEDDTEIVPYHIPTIRPRSTPLLIKDDDNVLSYTPKNLVQRKFPETNFKTPKNLPPKKCVTAAVSRTYTPISAPRSCVKPSQPVRSYSAEHDVTHYSFLASLSTKVNHEHRRDPSAVKYVNHFKKNKEELCAKLLKIFNETVFNKQLPSEMPINWNSKMYKTAGYCAYKRDPTKPSGRFVRVELSEKVCDTAERVRDTLAHELCHAIVWFAHGKNDGHGPYWKFWANKVNTTHPDIPFISRCHSYVIATKYIYKCSKCGYQIGRHSKSLDTTKKVCGYCRSPFNLMVQTKKGLMQSKDTPQTPKFALYVKENYSSVKKSNQGLNHRAVMSQLSKDFASKTKV